MSAAAWPEGVIARYVTVGGGTVDLFHERVPGDSQAMGTAAQCTGCPASHFEPHADYVTRFGADNAARDWAQDHAESCRAMPKPGGAK